MSDYTADHRLKLEAYLASHTIPKGMGSKKSACTVAAINLAMSGELTDDVPDCMSEVLGKAAIRLQDAMPDEMRNSPRYKALIPDMPGTGRGQEKERLEILLDWMWGTVLPQLQPIADKQGFGDQWRRMCKERAPDAAATAASAASAAYAADAAADAADRAAHATDAAAADAADAADYAAHAAANAAARADYWTAVDPIGMLERMTYLGGAKP